MIGVLVGGNMLKMAIINFWFSCVGRGVLRFWEGWYRKTRSNFGVFYGFCGNSI